MKYCVSRSAALLSSESPVSDGGAAEESNGAGVALRWIVEREMRRHIGPIEERDICPTSSFTITSGSDRCTRSHF
jgi:hypothetical protein